MMRWPERALAAIGALAGALGVVLAAMAAHVTGGGNLETASRFLLLHAPVLLALAALVAAGHGRRIVGLAAGWVMVLGLVLFSGDLALRALWSVVPWRLAAPTGGVLLILSWLGIALAILSPGSPRRD